MFFTCELKPKVVHPSAFLLSPLQDRHVHRWPSPRKPRRHNMQGHHPAAFISSSKATITPGSLFSACSFHAAGSPAPSCLLQTHVPIVFIAGFDVNRSFSLPVHPCAPRMLLNQPASFSAFTLQSSPFSLEPCPDVKSAWHAPQLVPTQH